MINLVVYTTMFIIFYLFPSLFSTFEFTVNEDLNADNNFNVFGGVGNGGGATAIARSGKNALASNHNPYSNNNVNSNHYASNVDVHDPLADAFFYRKERH